MTSCLPYVPTVVTKEHLDPRSVSDDKQDRRTKGYPEIHGGGHKAKEARPTFVNLDDPDHHKQRQMIENAFEKSSVEKLRPMMQKTVDEILAKMIEKSKDSQPVDFMEQFAAAVPTQV